VKRFPVEVRKIATPYRCRSQSAFFHKRDKLLRGITFPFSIGNGAVLKSETAEGKINTLVEHPDS
jgi:hypothetical protein